MDLIKSILEVIKDGSTSWGQKISIFLAVIGLLFIIDFTLGISFEYQLNKKIEKIEKIHKIKTLYKKDSIRSIQIKAIEENIFEAKHYSEFISDAVNSTYDNVKSISFSSKEGNVIEETKLERNYIWMLISSNYSSLIIFPFLFFLPIYDNSYRNTKNMIAWFASLVAISLYSIFITWISFKIPLINDSPTYNYWLNVIIHTVFIVIGIIVLNKKKN